MVNSIEDIKKFINDKSFKKIFVLCGKKSFGTSGAENLFKKILSEKEISIFYKKSELPILEEWIEIINNVIKYEIDSLNDIIFKSYDLNIKYVINMSGISINILNCFL